MSWITDLLDTTGLGNEAAGPEWGFSKIGQALIPTAVTAISSLFGANAANDLANRKSEQELIIAREKMANDLEQQKIAAGASAANAGAALAAAKIADARQREQLRLEAQQALLAGKLRAIELIKPENVLSGGRLRAETALQGGQNVASSYANMGQLLSSAYQRPR